MLTFPDKKYKVIYADPPWEYENKTLGRDLNAGAADHYSTISLDQLKALNVRDISDKDACLFLWAVIPQLAESLELMKAWGFQYKTAITWHKLPGNGTQAGLGFWFKGYVELLLFGIRGEVRAFHCQEPNIITRPIRRHSQKPEAFRHLIMKATVGLEPRIELFARVKCHGWDAWGNEVENLPTLEEYSTL